MIEDKEQIICESCGVDLMDQITRLNLRQIYEEFKEFISKDNELFQDLILNDKENTQQRGDIRIAKNE
jgi:hypothetical protein